MNAGSRRRLAGPCDRIDRPTRTTENETCAPEDLRFVMGYEDRSGSGVRV